MKTFTINIEKIKKHYEKQIVPIVKETNDDLYFQAVTNSPVDTWTYQRWHRNEWVRQEWSKIIWSVSNEVEYAERVESWFRQRPVNWNLKSLWQIYYSQGADVYAKSLEQVRQKLLNKLK